MFLDTYPRGLKDPDKKLYLYYYDRNKGYSRRRVTKYFNRYPDKAEAKKWLKKIAAKEANARHDLVFDDGSSYLEYTFIEIWHTFLNSIRNNSKSSIEEYDLAFRTFLPFAKDKLITEITALDIREYVNFLREKNKVIRYWISESKYFKNKSLEKQNYSVVDKKNGKYLIEIDTGESISENTIISYIKTLRAFFNYCLELRDEDKNPIIRENPVLSNKKLNIKNPNVIPKEIPRPHLEIILNSLIEKYETETRKDRKLDALWQYRSIMLLRLTAFHPVELCDLRWEYIDWHLDEIDITYIKSREAHRFSLFPDLKKFLSAFRKPQGKVIPYKDHRSFRFWRRLLEKLQLPPYKIKDIRNTTITDVCYAKDTNFEIVHMFTGHNDPKTTWKLYKAIRARQTAKDIAKSIHFGDIKHLGLEKK